MNGTENLCMSCMKNIGDEKKCPYCGFHIDTVQSAPCLPIRTVIANRYLVGKKIDGNGEGVTYIGWDMMVKKAVDIREFLPDSFTARTGSNLNLQVMLGSEGTFAELRRSFEELWSKLRRLNGLSALINVTDVIEDYGTSYAIYDHFDGISLRDFLLRTKTGYISWDRARPLLMPVLSTLNSLHKCGIIHMGISPSTLIIGEEGKIKIAGFSIAAERTTDSRIVPQIFDSYAAVEQYGLDSRQGPWTDIYAFAAVLYRSLIGSDPVPVKERMNNDRLMVPGKFAEAIPAYVINALINALQILPQDRTKTIEQLRAELSASPAATAQSSDYGKNKQVAPPAPPTTPPVNKKPAGKTPPQKGISGGKVVLITMLVTVLLGAGIFAALAMTVFKDKLNFNFGKAPESTSVQTEQYQVPNFVGGNYIDITTNKVFTSCFDIQIQEVYSEDTKEGYVISQNIAPDTMVDKGSSIILTVSKGVETIILPNVQGKIFDEVYQQLTDLGFDVEKTATTEGYYRNGEIISMAPISDKSYEVGTKVILKVYEEPTEQSTGEDDTTIIDEFGY